MRPGKLRPAAINSISTVNTDLRSTAIAADSNAMHEMSVLG